MRVLVTGHLGYIGTVLVPMLLKRGHGVAGLDSDLFRRCTFGELPDEVARVPNAKKDVRDAERADVEGFDAVIHLAALSNDPLGDLNPDVTMEINHSASVRLAEMAKAAGVPRFLFSSSCSNYGAGGSEWLDESSPFNPVTPYGESKVRTEEDLRSLEDDAFTAVSLRSATAYGASPRLRFDLVVNNLVAWAFTTGKVFLKSDGSAWRPLVHVEDIARAFCAVLDAPADEVRNEAFNVGSTADNLQIKDVAKIVGEVVPDCRIAFADGASADTRNYKVDCEKLPRTLPQFEVAWNVRRGAEQLLDLYRARGLELEDFEGPTYQRVAHVGQLIEEGVLSEDLRYVSRSTE